MSRREEEFKHRTSIFEGAYRAWSHLGGMDVEVLFDATKSVKDFDPIQHPLLHDKRISGSGNKKGSNHSINTNDDGTVRMEYPYEPLPRCGLTHPYIQAILSPWLGPNADQDAIELGLATLRTWWQHRRKGENKSALRILGTNKMRIIVDKYTKHFFDLAYCLVTNDNVQAPRTLHLKLKQSDKLKHRFMAHRSNSTGSNVDDDDDMSASMNSTQQQPSSLPFPADELAHLTPLERMHIIQKNALQQNADADYSRSSNNVIHIKGKCLPGKIDLPGIVDAVKRHANNLAHRGGSGNVNDSGSNNNYLNDMESDDVSVQQQEYGDPTTTPLIFVSSRNEYSIVLKVEGITCAHCVKIVETVLKGCAGANSMNGNKSPINGLLDAAADHGVSSVIILIDHPLHAKRIAYESKRNLSLVGYVAQAITVPLESLSDKSGVGNDKDPSSTISQQRQAQRDLLLRSMIDIAKAYPIDFFDFHAPCTCPDSGVYRMNCPRHSQMDDDMFDKLSDHQRRVIEYVQSKRFGNKNSSIGKNAVDHTAVTTLPRRNDQLFFEEPTTSASAPMMMGQQHHYDHSVVLTPSHESGVAGVHSVVLAPTYESGVGGEGYNNTNTDHALHIEQDMQFLTHDGHDNALIMNEPLSTIDVDPIPYYSQNQQQYVQQEHQPQAMMPPVVSKHLPAPQGSNYQQQTRYSMLQHSNNASSGMTYNNLRGSTSALSIDWEVYELFNEFVSSGGTDENESIMMGGPLEDYHQNPSGNTNVNPAPVEPVYRASHPHPIQQQQPDQASHDIFQV